MAGQSDYGTLLSSVLLPLAHEFEIMGLDQDRGVSDNSFAFADAEAMEKYNREGFRNPIDLVALLLISRQMLVVDLLRGMSIIAAHGADDAMAIGFSPAVLARAILEALRDIVWHSEPNIGAQERVRRLVLDTSLNIYARARTIPALRTADEKPLIETDELLEMADAYGVRATKKRHKEFDIDLPQIHGQGPPKAMQAMPQLMPTEDGSHAGVVFYHLMSDVAHASTPGVLGRSSIRSTATGLDITMSRDLELSHASPVYWAVGAPALQMADYMGWDTTSFKDTWRTGSDRLAEAQNDRKTSTN